MFKQKSNLALVETQQEMETLMTLFEQKVFSSTHEGVTVSLYGTMEMKSVESAGEEMSKSAFNHAYQTALKELKSARSVALIKIRNNIQKKHRVDMAAIVPEMKDAISYMDALKAG